MINRFKQPAKAAALAVFVLAGSATVASAHSVKACMWAVIEFCGTDQACRASGFAGCQGNAHQHPGSPPPEAPDPAFSADPGHTFNKGKNFKMR
ncbi:MAG TPA: hypothetical protein VFO09_03805 [Methyloceanibacter sp.]|nr:hypothetical protein [Methyloceanibacter sp.]